MTKRELHSRAVEAARAKIANHGAVETPELLAALVKEYKRMFPERRHHGPAKTQ